MCMALLLVACVVQKCSQWFYITICVEYCNLCIVHTRVRHSLVSAQSVRLLVSYIIIIIIIIIVNSVCWSHALVCGPNSKRPSSDGGLCSGQLLMM